MQPTASTSAATTSSSAIRPSAASDDEWITDRHGIRYRRYKGEEEDMTDMMSLVDEELSEPYNIYTFRYFLVEWPHLAYLAFPPLSDEPASRRPIATVICKQERHRGKRMRGYIGMLSVESRWRRKGIARKLAELAIAQMEAHGADEIVLETEYDNAPSLALYASLGFMREKRLHRFYLNGKDAFRLVKPVVRHHGNAHDTEETPSEADEAREHIGTGPAHLAQGDGGGPPAEEDRPGDMYGLDYDASSSIVDRVRRQVANLVL